MYVYYSCGCGLHSHFVISHGQDFLKIALLINVLFVLNIELWSFVTHFWHGVGVLIKSLWFESVRNNSLFELWVKIGVIVMSTSKSFHFFLQKFTSIMKSGFVFFFWYIVKCMVFEVKYWFLVSGVNSWCQVSVFGVKCLCQKLVSMLGVEFSVSGVSILCQMLVLVSGVYVRSQSFVSGDDKWPSSTVSFFSQAYLVCYILKLCQTLSTVHKSLFTRWPLTQVWLYCYR